MTTLLYLAGMLLTLVVGVVLGVWFSRRDEAQRLDQMITAAMAIHAERPRPRARWTLDDDPPGDTLTALLDALKNERGVD